MGVEKYRWHTICLKSLLILNLFDAVCTYIFVKEGLATELNPFMAWVLEDYSPIFILYKVTVVSLGVLLLWRLQHKLFCRIMTIPATVIYAVVGIIHLSFIGHLLFT